ncbi:MAG: sugar transferase [Thermoleophilia bacterium]|nr:sugar transferase [Thermoleophilia bacterium]
MTRPRSHHDGPLRYRGADVQDTVPETPATPAPDVRPVGGAAKRAVDLAVAVPATIALIPVMAAVALWVRLDSHGPAVFRQRRVGAFGHPFTVLKFRSMTVDAETTGAGLAVSADDERITRAGRILRRLSLDELPQLINIIRGEMSIVGPRPTVASQVVRYDDVQRRRLLARPGLTGLAQIRGRAAIPWSQRIALDVHYVDNWSMGRDLRILAETVRVVLRGEGAYRRDAGGFDLRERTHE